MLRRITLEHRSGEQSMSRTAIHPDRHLAERLKELGRQLKVLTRRITGIVNGERMVTEG